MMKHPRFKSQDEADNYVFKLAQQLQKRTDKLAQRRYISQEAIFFDKAKILCPTFRNAKGYNQKLNVCLDCTNKKCVVQT